MKGVMNAVLDYPTWFELVPAFVSPEGDFDVLKTIVQQTQSAYTSGAFMTGSFLENHDHPRFGSLTSDPAVRATLNPSLMDQLKCEYSFVRMPLSGHLFTTVFPHFIMVSCNLVARQDIIFTKCQVKNKDFLEAKLRETMKRKLPVVPHHGNLTLIIDSGTRDTIPSTLSI